MGNLQSSTKNEEKDKTKRRKELEKQVGVLIPPTFAMIGNKDKIANIDQMSLNDTKAYVRRLGTPDLLQFLWITNPGRRLLDEYMTPGIGLIVPTSFTISSSSTEDDDGQQGNNSPKNNNNNNTQQQPPKRTNGQVLVALDTYHQYQQSQTSSSSSSSNSFLWAGQAFDPSFQVELLVPTDTSPAIQVSYSDRNNNKDGRNNNTVYDKIFGRSRSQQQQQQRKNAAFGWSVRFQPATLPLIATSTDDYSHNVNNSNRQHNWIETKYKTKTSSGIDILLGSWMDLQDVSSLIGGLATATAETMTSSSSSFSSSGTAGMKRRPLSGTTATVHLQGGAEYQSSLMAAHVEVPISITTSPTLLPPHFVSTMVSMDINHNPNVPSTKKPSKDHQPPLWLTFITRNGPSSSTDNSSFYGNNNSYHSSTSSSPHWILNLSQVLTFDRWVWNIFEDRAPSIRQNVGWVVQVEKGNNHNMSSSASSRKDINTTTAASNNNVYGNLWSVGMTWQWNRSLAGKVVMKDNFRTINYGLLVKRWKAPRTTLSIINQYDIANSKHSMLGFGIEVETTSLGGASVGGKGTTATASSSHDDSEGPTTSIFPSLDDTIPETKIVVPKDELFKRKQQNQPQRQK